MKSEKRAKHEPSDIGKRLKRIRRRAGIDPEVLSAVCGLSRTHVHCIEVGWIVSPRQETLLALSRVLGVSLDHLLAGRGGAPSAEEVKAAFGRAQAAFSRAQAAQ